MNERGPIVIWQITRACRAGCSNCAIGATARRESSELATMEGYQTIDQIRSIKPSQLILTGGDVFERDDLDKLVDYARRCQLEPSVEVSGTSSLTRISVQRLARAGARRLVIGLDGWRAADHESVRGSRDTFSTSVAAARWAHQSSLHVEVNTTATPRTLANFTPLADVLEKMAIQRWNIWFPVPVNASKGIPMLSAFETEAMFELIYQARIKRDFPIRVFEAPHYHRFMAQRAQSMRTSVAADLVFVSATGNVTPDPFCDLRAGNLRYQPLRSIVESSAVFSPFRRTASLKGKCARCEWSDSCGGSRARALAMVGDVFAPDPLCVYRPESMAVSMAGERP